jgi:hypothetical protein
MTTNVMTAGGGFLEKLSKYAAVIGAVVGAITALWGVYEKVRAEARRDTAASYNTLAPQVNQMGEALKQLQQENQQLREIVALHQGQPRIAKVPPARKPPARAANPANAPTAPAETPPAQPTPAPEGTAAPAVQDEAPRTGDAVDDLMQTVGRTRAAIETLRKVPDDFGRVLEKKQSAPPEKPAGTP